MDFDFTEEQQLLADSVRKYLDSHYDFEARKKAIASSEGISDSAWGTFAEMGLTAIPFAPKTVVLGAARSTSWPAWKHLATHW